MLIIYLKKIDLVNTSGSNISYSGLKEKVEKWNEK